MNTSYWLKEKQPTILSDQQRSTHTYVIGQPGTGKSRALESWIRQDINLGHGVGVIDPHGDLFNHLVAYLATQPQTWDRVILLDPTHPKWTLTFNPLEAIEGLSPERLSLFMTDIVVKIWGIDSTNSPRLVWLLTNSFLAPFSLAISRVRSFEFVSTISISWSIPACFKVEWTESSTWPTDCSSFIVGMTTLIFS